MKSIDKQLPPKIKTETLRDHFKSAYKLADNQVDTMLVASAKSLATSFTALYAAIDNDEELDQIFRLAHSIKGLLLNMGEKQWAELAREVELAAADGQELDYLSMVKDIHSGVENIL